MAFTNGYLSGSETTEREFLLNEIVVRSPAETPFLATLPTFTMDRRYVEWSLDRPYTSTDAVRNIGAPHENSRAEGADFSQRTAHYAVRPRAIAEIQHFSFDISRTDMRAVVAGVSDTFDYRSSQLATTLLNNMETTVVYGQGSPETSGESTDERRTQGIIFNSAWTGLERTSGSSLDNITDPTGVAIPSDFWSVFYNANRSPLTRRMLYNQVMATSMRAGGRWESPWIFHCGYKTMGLVADFLMDPAGGQINDRNVSAESGMGYDFIAWMRMPSGHRVGFRTNRYMDVEGSTYTVDPSGGSYTPGAPASPGGQGSVTFQGDQTIIGYEPGSVSIGYVDAPHFVNVPTDGDYARLAVVSEFAVRVKSPLCVAGIGNCGS